jgi:tRNA-specific 2-thiouridylase
VLLKDVNWLGGGDAPFACRVPFDCRVKVRSMRPPVAATVTPLPGGTARVELAASEDAIAPGQACVFYETSGSRVLGGGWITAESAAQAA